MILGSDLALRRVYCLLFVCLSCITVLAVFAADTRLSEFSSRRLWQRNELLLFWRGVFLVYICMHVDGGK